MAYIEFKDVIKAYGEGDARIHALDGASFTVERGELAIILGASGAGKTTALNILGGMDTATSGTVTVDGIDTAVEETQLDVRRRVGLVQQNPDNQHVAGIVEEDVAIGPEHLGNEPAENRRRVEAAQKAVDLLGGEISDKIEFQLPGGDMGRTLVVIDKIKKTPKKYPRKAGTPAKMPIV